MEKWNELAEWIDVAGLMPPLPLDIAQKIQSQTSLSFGSAHTFLPHLITRQEFYDVVLPALKNECSENLIEFTIERVEKTFEIRHKLKRLQKQIIKIVGEGNFSALWLDREAFSADSMEHRALVTEAVIHVYSAQSLQQIVSLLYKHKIPMIPYGEGGGYNMGVTPMAPAVTISVRGLDHISEIRPSRRNEKHFEITVGAGVPFKDLIAYLAKRGYVLRCDPNTPRAATGGIAATGSNSGRKAFEVILHGRAVVANGTALCFEADKKEQDCIQREPFLMAKKFFSISNVKEFKDKLSIWEKKNLQANVTPNSKGIVIPLKGMKAHASHLAQQFQSQIAREESMQGIPPLPISAFVGAEGTTGFIYEVTFEIERPLPFLQASQWNFGSVESAMTATKLIKQLPKEDQPEFFEVISGESIRRYLIQDFPSVFFPEDAAVLMMGIEGESKQNCEQKHQVLENLIFQQDALKKQIHYFHKTSCMNQSEGIHEFEKLRKPREELPKKLRTKCKTDMEIRTEYLPEVLKIIQNTKPKIPDKLKNIKIEKQDVLFGHLTPNHTAIIHWNIGGFDLYDEDQSSMAWDYLEEVFSKSHRLSPQEDPFPSAQFTGEHGLAGKAAFLWLNYIEPEDFERMCEIKNSLDPENLFNPETLFLRTSLSRSLRARLLNSSAALIQNSLKKSEHNSTFDTAEKFAIQEGLKCTRCNSCKICPVIDAEQELEREKQRNSAMPVLPSKRNILMFMEWVAHLRKNVNHSNNKVTADKIKKITNKMFEESAQLLKKCFYCRRCDKACPVDIQIHPLTQAYHAMGNLPATGSKIWGFLYERLMGDDFFKPLTYRFVALKLKILGPVFSFLRARSFLPMWLKTYLVPPTLSLTHYEPLKNGEKIQTSDNFVVINVEKNPHHFLGHENYDKETVYIRYRGCMDTFGNPKATVAVDEFFKKYLNARVVDLEKKMCCGFPFQADGLVGRAKQLRLASLVEIVRCGVRLLQESEAQNSRPPKFIVFSNCPTCCEAISEMRHLFSEPSDWEKVRHLAKIPADFDWKKLDFSVQDTAEIAVTLLKSIQADQKSLEDSKAYPVSSKKVALKVPCHNTKSATKAQMELLKMYFQDVGAFDRCCGLSGTGRLKHPKIGTKISEKLFETIDEFSPQAVVSGCPSCRDGVKIQQEILTSQNENKNQFEIRGIFEEIMLEIERNENKI